MPFKWLFLLLIFISILFYIPMIHGYPERRAETPRLKDSIAEPFWSAYSHSNKGTGAFFNAEVVSNSKPLERKKSERIGNSPPHSNRAETQRERYIPVVFEAANQYRVDPALILAIIKTESDYDPYAVSKAGAIGLMQLMPRTARELGVRNSFDPEQNITGGVKYFSQLLEKFSGNHAFALAAYNAGSRKVMEYKGIPPYKETRQYIKRVFKYREQYKHEIIGG